MPIVIARGLRRTAVGSLKVAVDGLAAAAMIGRLTGAVACTPATATGTVPFRPRLATCVFVQATRATLKSSRRSRHSTRGECLTTCLGRAFIVTAPDARVGLACADDARRTPGRENWPSSDALLKEIDDILEVAPLPDQIISKP